MIPLRRLKPSVRDWILGAVFVLTTAAYVLGNITFRRQIEQTYRTSQYLNLLKLRLGRYASPCGTFPTQEQGVQATVDFPKEPGCERHIENGYLVYLLPTQDAFGHEIIYQVSPDRKSYVLRSYGKDGIPGGEGWNKDFEVRPNDPN